MTNFATGKAAEDAACSALAQDGFTILARRLRTPLGEIDVVAVTDSLLVFVEVKCRRQLAGAAAALGRRQQARLLGAAEYALALHPGWARPDTRFDVVLVDAGCRVRRIPDAFRAECPGAADTISWRGIPPPRGPG